MNVLLRMLKQKLFKRKDKLADYQEKFDTVKARIAELKEN